ncbi:hypothetical protein H8B02_36680 [Bradyrhizobium sp. Pear77]|uniref:hypothetical protein n=1 Tax=Bradyrhizobium TaxID=374 RepID=UPI001E3242D9|nr:MULTISPECIES: hypothetical protein [Bradyrhizobium]MCC8958756.1 hypothetical protein [Bradyrhizobium altum]MCC8967584.1 hypothetical protein [Bradyrhizobium oropedii]
MAVPLEVAMVVGGERWYRTIGHSRYNTSSGARGTTWLPETGNNRISKIRTDIDGLRLIAVLMMFVVLISRLSAVARDGSFRKLSENLRRVRAKYKEVSRAIGFVDFTTEPW